jgi:hypothetical protein
MYSPAHSIHLRTGRRVRQQRLAPCSSSVVLPLMPTWFDRAAAYAVTGTALLAIVAAAITSV